MFRLLFRFKFFPPVIVIHRVRVGVDLVVMRTNVSTDQHDAVVFVVGDLTIDKTWWIIIIMWTAPQTLACYTY